MLNILIRTSGRPNFFKRCYESVKAQTYKDYRVLVSDDGDAEYLKDYPVEVFKVQRKPGQCFWNNYFNDLLEQVGDGWIIYLDDDVTMRPDALEIISKRCTDKRRVIVWKYKFASGRVIPEKEFWKKIPTRKHIDTGCFCHHSKVKVRWVSLRASDWRVILKLWQRKLKFVWIDRVLFEAGNNGDIGKKTDVV